MKKLGLILAVVLLAEPICGAPERWEQAAKAAFDGWAKGERTGDYAEFEKRLSENFQLYSHPLQPSRGVYRGSESRAKLRELIAGRKKNPNKLEFTEVEQICADNRCVFQFQSEGKVAGGHPYKGWNAIQLSIRAGKVVAFREYFGDIEPKWFQNNNVNAK